MLRRSEGAGLSPRRGRRRGDGGRLGRTASPRFAKMVALVFAAFGRMPRACADGRVIATGPILPSRSRCSDRCPGPVRGGPSDRNGAHLAPDGRRIGTKALARADEPSGRDGPSCPRDRRVRTNSWARADGPNLRNRTRLALAIAAFGHIPGRVRVGRGFATGPILRWQSQCSDRCPGLRGRAECSRPDASCLAGGVFGQFLRGRMRAPGLSGRIEGNRLRGWPTAGVDAAAFGHVEGSQRWEGPGPIGRRPRRGAAGRLGPFLPWCSAVRRPRCSAMLRAYLQALATAS